MIKYCAMSHLRVYETMLGFRDDGRLVLIVEVGYWRTAARYSIAYHSTSHLIQMQRGHKNCVAVLNLVQGIYFRLHMDDMAQIEKVDSMCSWLQTAYPCLGVKCCHETRLHV